MCSRRSSARGRTPGTARSRREPRRGARDVHGGRRSRARASARRPKRGSSARACSDRRRRPGLARRCSAWKPSGRSPWSSGCSSTGSTATFTIATADGPRTIALRGKADRLDLLADGTFRLIDYKLGWPPNRARALQLPIYSLCAEQRLAGHRGRNWTLGEAVYLAFKGPRRVVPLFSSPADRDEGARRRAAAARRHRRRDRARRVSADAGRRLPLRDVQLRVGLPEGLCRRRLSRCCRSTRTTSATASATRSRRRRPAEPDRRTVMLPDATRVATPSIRRRTSCSRRRPAPARRACWSSATSTCCAPASSPITSSRSRSRARPRPRCASASSSGCRRRAGCREFDAARWRDLKERLGDIADLDHRRVLPVAAARVSARSRRRSRLRPRGRHRGAAAGRRVARSGAPDLPRRRARRRRCGAGVRAARRAAAAQRHRGAARPAAGRAARAAPVPAEGPARPDGRDRRAATAAARLRERVRRRARRPRRVPRTTARRAIRSSRCWRTTSRRAALHAARVRDLGSSTRREEQAAFRALIDRLRAYFLTQDGQPRGERVRRHRLHRRRTATADDAWKRHRADGGARSRRWSREAIRAFRRDLNVVMSRGVWRIFAVALQQYQRTLEAHALLDFSGVLERAVKLLKDMDEFAESRFRLEARYRHVLVDEFQDTSRAQWELVAQLVRSWGEGFGAASDALPPSIFIVGDRKQSIYGFRDADVAVLDEAADVHRARCGRTASRGRRFRSASGRRRRSWRSSTMCSRRSSRRGAGAARGATRSGMATAIGFRSTRRDTAAERWTRRTDVRAADATDDAVELHRRRHRAGGGGARRRRSRPPAVGRDRPRPRRPASAAPPAPADVAILFRSRDSHREFEAALERRGVPTYVYKGLGFFDADEVQDAVALLRYLADPLSDLRAATLLRSRIVRLSDAAVARLGAEDARTPSSSPTPLPAAAAARRRRSRACSIELRRAVPRWLSWVDRLTPSELLDAVLRETRVRVRARAARAGRRRART